MFLMLITIPGRLPSDMTHTQAPHNFASNLHSFPTHKNHDTIFELIKRTSIAVAKGMRRRTKYAYTEKRRRDKMGNRANNGPPGKIVKK